MIKVIHTRSYCGEVAFYFREKLNRGDLIKASNVILLNNSQPKPDAQIICGSCHMPISSSHHIKIEEPIENWRDWFIVKDL